MFRLDDLMVQWQLVKASAYKAEQASGCDPLEAHFAYEYGYLKRLADEGKVRIANLQVFAHTEEKDHDGKRRTFKIWQVTIGQQAEATQFWVTTVHPQGVVVLTIIASSKEKDVEAAKTVIDSYMGNFARVDSRDCQRLREQVSKGR